MTTYHVIITTAVFDRGWHQGTFVERYEVEDGSTESQIYAKAIELAVERLGTDRFSVLFYRAVPDRS